MKTTILAAALSACVAMSAWADCPSGKWVGDAYVCTNDQIATKQERPDQTEPTAPVRQKWGPPINRQQDLQMGDNGWQCVVEKTKLDITWHVMPNYFGHKVANPITACHIAPSLILEAIDTVMYTYNANRMDNSNVQSTWVDNHCHAEPAIPHNKWVCEQGDVTWETR